MIAGRRGLKSDDVTIYDVRGQLSVELHVEVGEKLNSNEAHQRISEFVVDCHDIVVKRAEEKIGVALHCVIQKDLSIVEGRQLSARLETRLIEHQRVSTEC